MAKIIKNNVRNQISDYLVRHTCFRGVSYKLGITDTETLSVKTVSPEEMNKRSGGSLSPAGVSGNKVYLSEVFHGANPYLKEFIVAHEVGHWVNDQDVPHPPDSFDFFMESELAADRFAMSLYPEKEYKDAARQFLLEMIVEGSHLMTSFSPDRLELMSTRLRVLATRLMHLK